MANSTVICILWILIFGHAEQYANCGGVAVVEVTPKNRIALQALNTIPEFFEALWIKAPKTIDDVAYLLAWQKDLSSLMVLLSRYSIETRLSGHGNRSPGLIRRVDNEAHRRSKANNYSKHMARTFSYTKYNTAEQIIDWLREIVANNPHLTQLHQIGYSYEGRSLDVIQIGVDPTAKMNIFVECGLHAREWISPAACIYSIKQMVENSSLTDNVNWYFLVLANPDGYAFTDSQNRMWRKNRRPRSDNSSECIGVDLNRNFQVGWSASGSSDNSCDPVFHGETAFSENETQAIRDFIQALGVVLDSYIAVHSFGQYIVYPWSYKDQPTEADELMATASRASCEAIKQYTGAHYVSGMSYQRLGATSGSSDDWAYGSGVARTAFTVELRDTGAYGFLLPEKMITDVGKDLLQAVITMSKVIGSK